MVIMHTRSVSWLDEMGELDSICSEQWTVHRQPTVVSIPPYNKWGCQTFAMTKNRRFGGQTADAMLIGEANYSRARLRCQ